MRPADRQMEPNNRAFETKILVVIRCTGNTRKKEKNSNRLK